MQDWQKCTEEKIKATLSLTLRTEKGKNNKYQYFMQKYFKL